MITFIIIISQIYLMYLLIKPILAINFTIFTLFLFMVFNNHSLFYMFGSFVIAILLFNMGYVAMLYIFLIDTKTIRKKATKTPYLILIIAIVINIIAFFSLTFYLYNDFDQIINILSIENIYLKALEFDYDPRLHLIFSNFVLIVFFIIHLIKKNLKYDIFFKKYENAINHKKQR